jgi:alpha-glucosidase
MTYVNPMLTDVTERKHSKVFWPWIDRNLFSEARAKGFLIHNNKSGELFMTKAFSTFSAGLLDLTNPDAVRWYKQIIKEEMLHKSQVFGFMADFGEASPIGNMDLDDKKVSLAFGLCRSI